MRAETVPDLPINNPTDSQMSDLTEAAFQHLVNKAKQAWKTKSTRADVELIGHDLAHLARDPGDFLESNGYIMFDLVEGNESLIRHDTRVYLLRALREELEEHGKCDSLTALSLKVSKATGWATIPLELIQVHLNDLVLKGFVTVTEDTFHMVDDQFRPKVSSWRLTEAGRIAALRPLSR